MKIQTKFIVLFLFILLLAVSSYTQTHNQSMCGYTDAERIFVGKVVRDSSKLANGIAEFSVNLHLKGFKSSESKILLYIRDSYENLKVDDEEYLVFTFFEPETKKHSILSVFPVTILGNISSNTSENFTQPDFRIAFGDTYFLMPEGTDFVKVSVIKDEKIIHPKFTKSGVFVLVYPPTLNFRINVETKSSIQTHILGNARDRITETKDGKRVASYRVNNSSSICNYNLYQFEDSKQ